MSKLTRRHGNTEKLSRRGRRARRGVALIVVVLMVSLAMAVSFAVVYSQGTAVRIHQNAALRVRARQAAQAGMAVALREVCRPNWSGVDTPISRNLSQSESFTVTFTTGDATLSEDDPEYAEYPYRVTIRVTGHVHDLSHPKRKAKHKISAVIRLIPLIPQAVDDEPDGWDEIRDNTFCQWKEGDVYVHLPCRIEGPVRIRGELEICGEGNEEEEIGWSDNVRERYLEDLKEGWPDYCPFSGPIQIAHSEQDDDTLDLLTNSLGVDESDADTSTVYSWTMPAMYGSYRLYPGGKVYNAETIDDDLSDITLKPDQQTNPLGIFINNGTTRFAGNVSLQGTLIGDGDVKILAGTNTFTALSVPPYSHRGILSGAAVQLPAVISDNHFIVKSGASVAVTGLVMVKNSMKIESSGQDNMDVTIRGNVMAKALNIKPRTDWQKDEDWWDARLADCDSTSFFPDVVQAVPYGLNPKPRIWIKPEGDEAAPYHWYNGNNPLCKQAKDTDGNDDGLRWELISWNDDP